MRNDPTQLYEEARWRAKRARMAMLLTDTDAIVPRAEFDELLEYSASLPSGTYIGKLWRSKSVHGWWLGEYFDDGTPGMIAIRWRRIHVVDDQAVWLAATYGERGATERPGTAALA